MNKKKLWSVLRALAGILLCLTLTAQSIPSPSRAAEGGRLEVTFLDVGQADAALVQCDGHAMLIDGGNAADSSRMYAVLKNRGISRLDYVIATHAHEDHIGGLAGALSYAAADTVYAPVTAADSEAFRNFQKAMQKQGVSLTVPQPEETFRLGSAECQILAVNSGSEPNDSSIVLRLTYGDTAFLFTGDAQRETEQAILDSDQALCSTVLKVAHHGSESSTGYRWLREVDPRYAVISVGKDNPYGHPTEEVLSRLKDAEVTTFRTDLQGDITCVSDGKTVEFTVARNADADVFASAGASGNSEPVGQSYVLNTNTKKFHDPTCRSVKQMKEKNRQDFTGSREDVLARGFVPCKNCNP